MSEFCHKGLSLQPEEGEEEEKPLEARSISALAYKAAIPLCPLVSSLSHTPDQDLRAQQEGITTHKEVRTAHLSHRTLIAALTLLSLFSPGATTTTAAPASFLKQPPEERRVWGSAKHDSGTLWVIAYYSFSVSLPEADDDNALYPFSFANLPRKQQQPHKTEGQCMGLHICSISLFFPKVIL